MPSNAPTPPDGHRSATDQEAPTPSAYQHLSDDLDDPSLQREADTGPDVRTPEPTEVRQGEAGNAYVGRQMKESQQVNPRVEDADRVQKDD